MNDEKHKIRRGDWIIRVPDDPPNLTFDGPFARMEKPLHDYENFSMHAVFVLDATPTHICIFDPLAGRPGIIVYDRFPGDWRYATEEQVRVTWHLARMARRDHSMQIELEIKEYKWKPLEKR